MPHHYELQKKLISYRNDTQTHVFITHYLILSRYTCSYRLQDTCCYIINTAYFSLQWNPSCNELWVYQFFTRKVAFHEGWSLLGGKSKTFMFKFTLPHGLPRGVGLMLGWPLHFHCIRTYRKHILEKSGQLLYVKISFYRIISRIRMRDICIYVYLRGAPPSWTGYWFPVFSFRGSSETSASWQL